jgi:hypothetical protein
MIYKDLEAWKEARVLVKPVYIKDTLQFFFIARGSAY